MAQPGFCSEVEVEVVHVTLGAEFRFGEEDLVRTKSSQHTQVIALHF